VEQLEDKTQNPLLDQFRDEEGSHSEEEKEMSFLDHLEELRWHLIRAGISIVVFALIAFLNKSFVFDTIIFGPSRTDFWTYRMFCKVGQLFNSTALCMDKLNFTIQSRRMTEQFTMHITSSIIIGLILAFPYAFWEIWRFIKPGLYSTEKKLTRGAVFFVSLLFLLGVLFGYYIVSPLSINFLAGYTVSDQIVNEFDISSYMETLITLVLACGLMFQLPTLVYVLSKMGVLSPPFLRQYRKHAIVVILVVSAIITPPDISSQILISMPLLVLYEISIWISGRVVKQRLREMSETV
jgi:sec-independent protein translocase protein TatC